MKHLRNPARLLIFAVLLSAWSVPVAAAAAPIDIKRDRSDNTMYFQYDAVTQTMPSAYSSRIVRRNDRVDFLAYVTERQREGDPLRGRLVVRLNHDRAVHYEGRLTLLVLDATGAIAFKGIRDVDFVLRPRKGRRARYFKWTFPLLSGDYTTFGRFKSV